MSGFARIGMGIVGLALLFAVTPPAAAQAQSRPRAYSFDLPAEALGDALRAFGQITQQQIIFSEDVVRGKRSPSLVGSYTVDEALRRLLTGSGLRMRWTSNGVIYIEASPAPEKGGAGGAGPTNWSVSVGRLAPART
jgi:iron complex outermembrane receptor protein